MKSSGRNPALSLYRNSALQPAHDQKPAPSARAQATTISSAKKRQESTAELNNKKQLNLN